MIQKKLPLILGSSFVGVIVAVGFVFWLVMALLKSSQPFKMAIAELQASSRINQHFGLDWQTGWWVTGSVSISGDQGFACLTIPFSGADNSEGTAYVDATKNQGKWQINDLTVEIADSASFLPQDTIQLVQPTHDNPQACQN